MFQVYIEPIIENCEHMETMLRSLNRQKEELHSVIRYLNSLSGMEEPIRSCRRCQDALERETAEFQEMLQGLGKTALLYRTSERKISENGENGIRRFRNVSVRMVQINTDVLDRMNIKLY